MVKLLYISFALFLGFVTKGQENDAIWLTDFDSAIERSKAEEKPILLVFQGSDWCKPCIMLSKEVFEQEAFSDFAKNNLVLVRADFPRSKKHQLSKNQLRHNEALAEKYNKAGEFPLVVLIDKNGKVIAETGYLQGGVENYVHHIQSLINEKN